MNAYHIRHTKKLGVSDETLKQIWESHKLAIHDGADKRSLDPRDYEKRGERQRLSRLVELAKDGGYICAEHFLYRNCLVGLVVPGTKIEIIDGVWGDRYKGMAGRHAAVKAVQLTKARELSPSENAALLVGRPRQGTLSRWPSQRQRLELLVEGLPPKFSLANLATPQQEVMCADFLRRPDVASFGLPVLKRLIEPSGRTMRDIDIFGLAEDGRIIFGQVTYLEDAKTEGKLAALKRYNQPESVHLVLFCRCNEQHIQEGVVVYPIQKVFDTMTTNDMGQRWLRSAVTGETKPFRNK